ncbi:TetR family transcriptional regulator [Phytomonospora sp. NPDC050363]|uniref:TetR/AcrR family transcriptional regulator n=1 Tax=Phytomonospora sp. NPDC050363 TaxID=3155642 RepID=UPI0033E3B766
MRSVDDLTGRARIRDAALELFGEQGFARVTVRAIAARAGVSPALLGHHFGSKEGLRQACDAHVSDLVRGGPDAATALDDPRRLAAMLEAAAPVRRYLARAFLEGSDDAAALFDDIVTATAGFLDDGTRDGRVQPADDPQTRAAVYVTWLLAPLVFDTHLARVLGVDDIHDPAATMRLSRSAVEMMTRGVFRDDSVLDAWDAAAKETRRA